MSFIIVWRNGHRDPFVSLDSHYFKESYSSFREAEEAAKEMEDADSEWYFDYAIYEEVNY